ncbi:MAG: hypothetical protein JXB13_05225 [Phycisphaerae bacterium]|nr:hypothetical protein [Phycisphaerae bacterium]
MRLHVIFCVSVAVFSGVATVDGQTWHEHGGHLYALTPNSGSWHDAQSQAQSFGADLVTIRSQAENDWLVSTLAPDIAVWIGLYQLPGSTEPDESWVWVSGEPPTFVNWWPGQPNEHLPGDDYALLNSDADDGVWFNGQWHDVPLEGWPGPHYGIMEIVPEPGTMALLAWGATRLLSRRRVGTRSGLPDPAAVGRGDGVAGSA